jgi:hypothetical protein
LGGRRAYLCVGGCEMMQLSEAAFIEASNWTMNQLARLRDGGVWVLPRSNVVIRVVSRAKLEAQIQHPEREPEVVMFMQTRGWKCTPVEKI